MFAAGIPCDIQLFICLFIVFLKTKEMIFDEGDSVS